MSDTEARLRELAVSSARLLGEMQRHKQERARANGEHDSVYATPKPSETFEWKAADELANLRSDLAAAQARVMELEKAEKNMRPVFDAAIAYIDEGLTDNGGFERLYDSVADYRALAPEGK